MKYKKTVAILLAAAMVSAAAAGCGKGKIDPSAKAATLDDKEISMGLANFMAQYQAVQYDAYLLSYYGEDMWTSDAASQDGTTMTDTVKDNVMENLEEMYLLDAHAADYKVSLTEEEQKSIKDAAAKFMSDNSSDAAEVMGASQENVEEMLRLQTIQHKMQKAIKDDIDKDVSAEEMKQKTFSYVKFDEASSQTSGTDDTSTDDTDAKKKEAKKTAQEFLDSVSKKGADKLGDLAKEKEYSVETASYGPGDLKEDDNTTSLPLAVLKAADGLKKGQLAPKLVEDNGVYYVVRMDNLDDKDAAKTKKESILSQRGQDRYTEVLEGYRKKAKWKVNSSEWAKVNFEKLYTVASDESDTKADEGGDSSQADTASDDSSAESTKTE